MRFGTERVNEQQIEGINQLSDACLPKGLSHSDCKTEGG